MFFFASQKSNLREHKKGALLALALLSVGAQAQAQLINSFETSQDINKPNMWTVGCKATQVTTNVTEGGKSLRLDYAPSTGFPECRIFLPSKNANFGASGGYVLDITNPGTANVVASLAVVDNKGQFMTTDFTIRGGASLSIRMGNEISINPLQYGLQAIPNPYAGLQTVKMFPTATFNTAQIEHIRLFLRRPTAATTLIVDNFRQLDAFDINKYLNGWVDEFGQNARANYTGKIQQASQLPDVAASQTTPTTNSNDRFGGWKGGAKQPAAGFFRTALVNGKWWLVTPEGNLFFSAGMTTVRTKQFTIVEGRESMFKWLPSATDPLAVHYGTNRVLRGPLAGKRALCYNFYAANLQRKYGADWANKFFDNSQNRLQSWGFNTLGVAMDANFYGKTKMPYVIDMWSDGTYNRVSTGVDYWVTLPDPYDPKFPDAIKQNFKNTCRAAINDPYLIGYTVDNEFSWIGNNAQPEIGVGYGTMAQSTATSFAKQALVKMLQDKYGPIKNLNTAWGTSYDSWTTVSGAVKLPATVNAAAEADLRRYVRAFADQYYRTVNMTMKQCDPNHLYLGSRLASITPEVVAAAAANCDVVSFNYYGDFNPNALKSFLNLNKPTLMTEFHFGATDRGNPFGGLAPTRDQNERAQCLTRFMEGVAGATNLVGCHWLQYVDQPVSGQAFDGQNGGIGFVDVADKPQPEIVAAATAANRRLFGLRYGG